MDLGWGLPPSLPSCVILGVLLGLPSLSFPICGMVTTILPCRLSMQLYETLCVSNFISYWYKWNNTFKVALKVISLLSNPVFFFFDISALIA